MNYEVYKKIIKSMAELYDALLEVVEKFARSLEEKLLDINGAYERIENKQTFSFMKYKKFLLSSQVILNKPKFVRARTNL